MQNQNIDITFYMSIFLEIQSKFNQDLFNQLFEKSQNMWTTWIGKGKKNIFIFINIISKEDRQILTNWTNTCFNKQIIYSKELSEYSHTLESIFPSSHNYSHSSHTDPQLRIQIPKQQLTHPAPTIISARKVNQPGFRMS
jgi:hypothetical protein